MCDAQQIVDSYFAALAARDLASVRRLVHDDLIFTGPLATLDNADDYLTGLEHITANVQQLRRRNVVGSGDDIVQIYDVILPDAVVPVAEWLNVRDGRIARIEMMLDPRPLAAPVGH